MILQSILGFNRNSEGSELIGSESRLEGLWLAGSTYLSTL